MASCVAYLLGEAIDWLVYSLTKKPLRDRVLLSSLLSTPVDSAVFLAMIGFCSVGGVLLMTVSKMLGAGVVYLYLKRAR